MTVLSINPALVNPVTNTLAGIPTQTVSIFCNQPINAGQTVCITSPNAVSLTLPTDFNYSMTLGIALETSSSEYQLISIAVGGDVIVGEIGGTLMALGDIAQLFSSPGSISIDAQDQVAGMYPSLVGIAINPWTLRLAIVNHQGVTI